MSTYQEMLHVIQDGVRVQLAPYIKADIDDLICLTDSKGDVIRQGALRQADVQQLFDYHQDTQQANINCQFAASEYRESKKPVVLQSVGERLTILSNYSSFWQFNRKNLSEEVAVRGKIAGILEARLPWKDKLTLLNDVVKSSKFVV